MAEGRQSDFFRNFIFGVEDSLVSAVGVMSGIALAGIAGPTILVTGVVYIFVEAFSMAAGSYLSERSGAEYSEQAVVAPWRALTASSIMFVSYLVAGIIPIAPYVYLEPQLAFTVSIVGSLLALFVLGAVGARFSHTPVVARATQMAVVGGVAILLGIAVGQAVGYVV
jgi:VIT1/CCC1 family predicted Fe2+/Mn2+ transporter